MLDLQRFLTDDVGYTFYSSSTKTLVYSTTKNGGDSWSAAITIDANTDCISPTIWYDQWKPGDLGTTIHIAYPKAQ